MSTKRKPHIEEYKLELEGARLQVWIKFRAKDSLDAILEFDLMSERTLRRLVNEGQATIRVLDTGTYACVIDSAEIEAEGGFKRLKRSRKEVR